MAMPHANAEVVRRLTDALWKERDLDAARNLIHPEADFARGKGEALPALGLADAR
jgi:hypothetical protein